MYPRRFDPVAVMILASVVLAFSLVPVARGELPIARLTAVFPPGARPGTTVTVTLTGQDLDDLTALRFSDPRVTAKPIRAGVFDVTIPAEIPASTCDVRAVGRYGISNPRAFAVGALEESVAKPGNNSPYAAAPLRCGTTVSAVAQVSAVHYYRLTLKKGEQIVAAIAARSIDSRLEPAMLLTDSAGRQCAVSRRGDPISFAAPDDGDYLLGIHDVTYRGGAEFFYRLTVAAPASAVAPTDLTGFLPSTAAFLDAVDCRAITGSDLSGTKQKLEIPCDVTGRFPPRGGLTRFTFDTPAGAAYSIQIYSHRLGQPTSPFLLLQRVTVDDRGVEKLTDLQEVYESPLNLGGPEFKTASRDPACRLDVKEAGRYRLTLRNLFTTGGGAKLYPYRLAIRRETPDFRLVAFPAPPIQEKDSKDIPLCTQLLRRGGVTPIKVVAQRRDGFAGEIQLNVQGLPPGVTCAAATIAPGATSAILLLAASPSAGPCVAPLTIAGTATLDGTAVTRSARPGTIATSTYDAGAKIVEVYSRCAKELPVAVIAEAAPLSMMFAPDSMIETSVFGKIALPLKLVHRGTMNGPLALRLVGHPLLAPMKDISVDPLAETASFELDLTQVKLPPGEYDLHAQTLAKLKYVPAGGQAKDLSASFYSTPIHLLVTPAPITLTPPADVTVAAGAQADLPIAITRLYKYADAVDLVLLAPNSKGLSGKAVIAKDQSQAKLAITADAATPPGKQMVKLQAALQLNGQRIVVEQPLTVTITGKPAGK
jgi:hypothetical protein